MNALKSMNEGIDDLKKNRIFNLTEDLSALRQKSKETIDQYYGRFAYITNQLLFLGEDLEPWKQNLFLVHGLNKKFSAMALQLKLTKSTNSLSVQELIGELKIYESEKVRQEKDEPSPSMEKGLALKVAKAFQHVDEERTNEDLEEDTLTTLITKAMRQIYNKGHQ